MKLFSHKIESLGLDVSDLSLKIVKLEKEGAFLKLSAFGEKCLPVGVVSKGVIKNEKVLGQAIKQLVGATNGGKSNVRQVVCSLPEEKSFLDVLRLPLLDEEHTAKVVVSEAESSIPLPLSDVYFGFEIIKPIVKSVKYQEVLVAACPKKIVDSYFKVLKSAGLQPCAMEIESLSIVRALIKKETLVKPTLLIDFGENRAGFVIFAGHGLRFTSTISVSSRSLTEAIKGALKVDFKQAEKLKISEGLIGKKQVFQAMMPFLTDFVQQAQTYLNYYHSHALKSKFLNYDQELERIVLCGGGANLKGFDDFLSSELKIAVELGNPWVNLLKDITEKAPKLPLSKALGYTTAIGLALRTERPYD